MKRQHTTLVEVIDELKALNVNVADVGYTVLYAVLDNRSHHRQLYRDSSDRNVYKREEMHAMETGLVKLLSEAKKYENPEDATLTEREVKGTRLQYLSNEEVWNINFIYDAVCFLRSKKRSPSDIADSLGRRAYNLVPGQIRKGEEPTSWESYVLYLQKIKDKIFDTFKRRF